VQNPYQYSSNQENHYANNQVTSNNYNPTKNEQDVSGSFTSDAIDRQDAFGDGMMPMFALGLLAAFGAGAATVALVQNAQQATDYDDLKGRVASLESDQTNICTAVKSFVRLMIPLRLMIRLLI